MKHVIKINTQERFKPLRAIWSASTIIGVIGVGVVLDSAAMQWAGFLVLMLLAFAIIVVNMSKNDGLTISEARKRLDEIEANQ